MKQKQRLSSFLSTSSLVLLMGISLSVATLLQPAIAHAQVTDLTAAYNWKPVRLGAGGFVTGFITHPLNANVRYCRTDVGNAYRWDNTNSVWVPMVVKGNGTGMPSNVTSVPSGDDTGIESIALDPTNTSVVYLSFQAARSSDIANLFPSVAGNVYKSTNGGVSFTAGNLAIPLYPNGNWRTFGERMMVDPSNSSIIYYGSHNGLYRSVDGGVTWSLATLGGSNVLTVQFSKADGTAVLSGKTVSKVVYLTVANGSVYKSSDGGNSWSNISVGQTVSMPMWGTPASATLDGHAAASAIDASGNLYVVENESARLWKYKTSWTWTTVQFPNGQPIQGLTISKTNNSILWAIGNGGTLSRTTNGATNWTSGSGLWTPVSDHVLFANTFAWLPQTYDLWRSNGGITFDANGKLWISCGNEGMLGYVPNNAETETAQPSWAIDSKGIEEFVSRDAILPPGGKLVVAVEDSTALTVTNPDLFTAKQATLQNQLISNGTSLDYCPNAPNYVVCATADVNRTGTGNNYSGFSTDGGTTWQKFAGYPYSPEGSYITGNVLGTTVKEAGTIAVSRRGAWGQGSDHLVWIPSNNFPPYYSTNGGASWARSPQFAANLTVHTEAIDDKGNPYVSSIGGLLPFWSFGDFSFKQRQLIADPFTPDRFYMNFTNDGQGGGLHISTNGGQSWTKYPSNLPTYCFSSKLVANPKIQNDLWFVDGFEGATEHGLYRSTNGGTSFTKVTGIDNAITLALGKGSGVAGAQPYTIYLYGKVTGNSTWGVFSSTNGGTSWNRVANYPTGIFDRPTCMTASWDTYGTVYVGFKGNSFVYGTTGATAQTIYTAYDEALATDWSDWSWSTVNNFVNTSPVKTGTKSLKVDYAVNGGLSLRKGTNFSTTGYTAIKFWANSLNTARTLSLYIQTSDGAGASNGVNISVLANAWGEFTVPLSSLGSPTSIKRISIQSATAGTVYFDNIRIVP
jgi:hypothetical protein